MKPPIPEPHAGVSHPRKELALIDILAFACIGGGGLVSIAKAIDFILHSTIWLPVSTSNAFWIRLAFWQRINDFSVASAICLLGFGVFYIRNHWKRE